MNKLNAVLLLSILLSACARNPVAVNRINTEPVTGFELSRYLGTWYEIARYPHSFEKRLTGVTATYTIMDNGMIRVVNAGYSDSLDGRYRSVRGRAKLSGDQGTGHLKVSFFLFFFADYRILELDKSGYQWAVVGSSSPDYLWILSRTPALPESVYNDLVNRIVSRGYSIERLEKVPQRENGSSG